MKLPGALILRGASRLALVAAILVLVATPAHATSADIVPTSAITNVRALGVSTNTDTVYIATDSELYRSASPTFDAWTPVNVNAPSGIYQISPNPNSARDLVLATSQGIMRSTDGGRTLTVQSPCP
jgi:hypothetical protein